MMRWWVGSWGLVSAGMLYMACQSGNGTVGQPGEQGGPCFANGTCNPGLVCLASSTCAVPDAGGDGGSDAGPASTDAAGDAAGDAAAGDASDANASACGAPGQPCCDSETCNQGGCCVAFPPYPPGKCVGAGQTCPNGGTCNNDICGTCGGPAGSCCPPSVDAGITDPYCTGPGLGCGFTNGGAYCDWCGGPGGPCCPGGTCLQGYTCYAGISCN